MGVKLYTRRDLAKLLSIGIAGTALESSGAITRSALALRGAMMGVGKMRKTPWIKFDGASVIILGLITSNISVEIEAVYDRAYGILCGTFSNSTYYTVGRYSSYVTATVWGAGRRANLPASLADGTAKRRYLVNPTSGFDIDGEHSDFSGDESTHGSIYFAVGARGRSATSADNYSTAKVYSCNITNLDGEPMYNLIPVALDGGVGALKDTLSGGIFTGIGSGTIQYGEDDA